MKQQFVLRVGAALALVLSAGGVMAQVPSHAPEIKREGLGAHRTAMDALELKPAPADWLASLSDWTGGPAPTDEKLKGQVVVLLTWTSWHPPSVAALARMGKLLESHASKGLVVIAAHRGERFEQATKVAGERGFKGLVAKDSGELRKALGADSDPNVYLIDRAGNLRFADLANEGVEAAVDLLLAETAEAAAKVPATVAAAKSAVKPTLVTRDLSGNEQAGRKPVVKFPAPPEAAYTAAAWHKKNDGKFKLQDTELGLGGDDRQGQAYPGFAEFLQGGLWLTPAPESAAGKVLIVYFWTPQAAPGYRFTPQVEELRLNNLDDVVVVAVTGADAIGSTDNRNKLTQAQAERWLRENRSPLHYLWDEPNNRAKALNVSQVPQVYVVSTDGIIRWQGHPLDKEMRRALDVTLAVDPGIRARRAAEAAAMKSDGGK